MECNETESLYDNSRATPPTRSIALVTILKYVRMRLQRNIRVRVFPPSLLGVLQYFTRRNSNIKFFFSLSLSTFCQDSKAFNIEFHKNHLSSGSKYFVYIEKHRKNDKHNVSNFQISRCCLIHASYLIRRFFFRKSLNYACYEELTSLTVIAQHGFSCDARTCASARIDAPMKTASSRDIP